MSSNFDKNGRYKGKVQKGSDGSYTHFDEYGRVNGRSKNDRSGDITHFDREGFVDGRSVKNSDGSYTHFDSHGFVEGRSKRNADGSYTHFDKNGFVTGSTSGHSATYYGGYNSFNGRNAKYDDFLKKVCPPLIKLGLIGEIAAAVYVLAAFLTKGSVPFYFMPYVCVLALSIFLHSYAYRVDDPVPEAKHYLVMIFSAVISGLLSAQMTYNTLGFSSAGGSAAFSNFITAVGSSAAALALGTILASLTNTFVYNEVKDSNRVLSLYFIIGVTILTVIQCVLPLHIGILQSRPFLFLIWAAALFLREYTLVRSSQRKKLYAVFESALWALFFTFANITICFHITDPYIFRTVLFMPTGYLTFVILWAAGIVGIILAAKGFKFKK